MRAWYIGFPQNEIVVHMLMWIDLNSFNELDGCVIHAVYENKIYTSIARYYTLIYIYIKIKFVGGGSEA